MKKLKIAVISLLVLVLLVSLNFAFGFTDVFYTKTVVKAKQNANREVYEQSKSFVEGKRQSAIKYYKEYNKATDSQKQALKNIISQDFASFDEDKYLTGELRDFIHNCKY